MFRLTRHIAIVSAVVLILGAPQAAIAQATRVKSSLDQALRTSPPQTVRKFLRKLAAEGRLVEGRDRRAAKRAWRRVVGRFRARSVHHVDARRSGATPNALVFTEREYNRSSAFADNAGILTPRGLQIDGSAVSGDVDTYAVRVLLDGNATLRLAGRGSTPISGGGFVIFNERGYVYQASLGSVSSFGSLQQRLPRGRYFVQVRPRGIGDYRLDCQLKLGPIPALPLRGTKAITITKDPSLYRFTVPVDGVYRITIQGGVLDSLLTLYNAGLSWMYEVDDDSASTNTDAGLRAHLVKGDYFIALEAGGTGAATVTTKFTPRSIPALACGKSLNGTIPGGEEDFQLYRLALSSAQELQVSVQPRGTTNVLSDAYLWVYDRLGNEIMESDDDWAATGSIVTGTFPKGTYYAASTGFFSAGDFTISAQCGAPVVTRAAPGTSRAAAIPRKDGHVTFTMDLGTPAGVDFQVFEQSLPDAELGVVSAATGLAVGWNDDTALKPDSEVSARLDRGRYYAIVHDYCGDDGTFRLMFNAPLFRDGSTPVLHGLGKNGDFTIPIASTRSVPGFLIAPFGGLFQLDLAASVVIGPVLIPGNGDLRYPFPFPKNTGVVLQALHLDIRAPAGEFTNVLR